MSVLEKFKLVELITTRTDAVITFVKGNTLKFNSATHIDLGYPGFVQFYVDEKSKQVAIKVCKETDSHAMAFSKPVGEQKYNIKIACAPVATTVRRIMGWTPDQGMNAPGAIFADEGVIIFALEKAYPVSSKGGWNVKRMKDAASAAAAADAMEALEDDND